jgi:PAS domain S-box-containing protein
MMRSRKLQITGTAHRRQREKQPDPPTPADRTAAEPMRPARIPGENPDLVVLARDATDCKRAEEALRQAEQTFRAIFDSTSDGIFLHDLQTRKLTMANQSCLQMLGFTEQEFLALHATDLHPEADRPFIDTQIEKFLQGGKPVRHDIRFLRKDGSVLFADVSPALVRLGGAPYVLVALKDITQRKQMEEELRQHAEHLEDLVAARTGELQDSETRYRSLYHTIADGIFVMGTEGRIEDVNDSACTQLGYTRAELLGRPVAAISARADFHLGEVFDRLRAAGSLSYETAHRRKDGTIIPVELSVSLTEYRGRPAVLGVARDITERKRVQEALQFTQFAIDHTADAAFWMTEDARFCYVNEAACQALGYSREELLQMTVYDIDPTYTERMWLEGWRELKAKKSRVLETVHQARNGRTYPVEIRANYLEFGGRAYNCAFARDITEHKRAQEALQEKEYLLSESQRIGHIGSWSMDLATGAGTWTRETFRLYGVSPDTFTPANDTFFDLLHPDDRAAMREWIRAAAAGEHPGVLEFRALLPDGSVRVLSGRGERLAADNDRPVRLVGTVQDVTEQKQAEEALRKSQTLYHDLVETSQDLIWQCDQEGRYTYLNSAWETTLGYALAEMLGQHFWAFESPEFAEQDRAQFARLMQGGAVKGYETVHRGKDGREIHLVFNAKSFQDERGKIVGTRGAAYDITERKRAQEAQRRLNEHLEQQVAQRTEDLRRTVRQLRELTLELSQAEDRERQRIADILHEDVQQTLAAAKFHLNLLGNEAYNADEVREIVGQVKHMLKDAIEKSRNLSHELSPALYQVDLLEILNWLARQMQQKHGLTVRVEAHGPVDSPSEPLKAFLYKVVQELLFNVVKHAEVSEARIRVRCLGQYLYLSVTDQGRGFEPHNLEGIIGCGLLGIRERVQLLGGRMRIKSAPGAGSKSLIAVPYEAAPRVAASSEDQHGQTQGPDQRGDPAGRAPCVRV